MRKRLTAHKAWRLPLVRWHRRIGIAASLLIIWLSVTGVLLNHSDQLQLNSKAVGSSLLLTLYGVTPPTLVSYRLNDHWLSHIGGNQIYLDDQELAFCTPPMSGAVMLEHQFVVSCGDGLLLLTKDGDVIERLGAAYGLPLPISALTILDGQLLLKTPRGVFIANLDQLIWTPYEKTSDMSWVSPEIAPPLLSEALLSHATTTHVSWERVMLDLHNGRLAGRLGIWLLDTAAILLILLAVSGLWIWFSRPSR